MSNTVKNASAIEQAAVALLAELHKKGVDVASVAEDAKHGIISSATYKWVSADLVTESQDAVDQILQAVKQSA